MTATFSERVSSVPTDSLRWFAVRTKPRCELLVQESLQRRGWRCCLPVSRGTRPSDRSASAESPLFPGFLFCRMSEPQRLSTLAVPAVVQVLGSRAEAPDKAEEAEMGALSALMAAGVAIEASPGSAAGRPVRLEDGLFEGVTGILVEAKGQSRLILPVHLIARWYSVDLDQLRLRTPAHAAGITRQREVA